MSRFRKKPVVIEAKLFVDTNWTHITAWIRENGGEVLHLDGRVYIVTLEGNMLISEGDWVICGVNGEFYPCKPGIFDQTYEAVE